MDQFTQVFEHIPQYRIVICKDCCKGLVRSQLRAHLNTNHKYLSPTTRKNIISTAAAIRRWAETEEEVVFPESDARPVCHLTVFENGFKCIARTAEGICGYIRRTVQDIQKHCREEHGWENTRKRGRPYHGRQPQADRIWVEGIHCQKFQSTGRLGRLFEVHTQEGPNREEREEREVQEALKARFHQATTELEQAEKEAANRIQADMNRFEANPWLNRVGWAKHLAGLDRDWLAETTRKPERWERALNKVCWAVETVIWKAQQASRASVVGLAAMNYINRREIGNDSNEKPFNARQTGKTMVKYSNCWLEVIRYIWRTHELAVVAPGDKSEEERGEEERIREKRPAYRLTSKQSGVLRRIQLVVGRDPMELDAMFSSDDSEDDINEKDEEKLEGLALLFMLALLNHPFKDDEYKSALMSGMAVLGIDCQCGWMSPLSYTPKIAAIVNIGRMLVLYRATQMRKEHVTEQMEQGRWSQKDAEEKAPGHFDFVQGMANQFMTLVRYGGQPCPVDALQRWKAYGMKVRFTTNAEGVIEWVDDTLLYGNIKFSMPSLRSMVHGLVATTRTELRRDLLLLEVNEEGDVVGPATLPAIDWEQLVDNPAERKVGWSFMSDPRNEAAGMRDAPVWLSQRIAHEKPLREAFVDVETTRASMAGGRNIAWRGDRMQKYGQAMRLFRQHLLVLVHMTGGLPARGTEVVTVQYKNSANGDSRGLFIEDGLVVYMTAYHKNIGASGKSKIIHRYLPREVGELMVYYLWVVLPFWEKLQRAVCGDTVESSAFVWEPEQEKGWTMPQKRRRAQEEDPQGKHKKKRGELGSEEEEPGSEDEGPDSEEEGPGSQEGRRIQPSTMARVERWDSQRVKSSIQKASLHWMGVKVNIMAWRHSSKAIYRRYIHDKAIIKAVVQGDEDECAEEDEAFDVQTGHGSQVGGKIYGRSITESIFSTEAERASLRRVSTEWHRFLQFQSALEIMPKRGTRAAAGRREAVDEEYRRWRRMMLVDVDEQLKILVGEGAQFRSVQKPAVEAIMRQKSPVVVVMGTGAGKSVLFMLPASCSTGVTVVVVPLVSLRQDMKTRCDRAGIECVEWDSRRPYEWAQVVLVTPEAAVGEAFGDFINRQRSMGRLDRIVVDECHVVLDSTEGWRSRMLGLRELVRVETQLVYLTATLRPSEESEFMRLMGLPEKEKGEWFRGRTTRKNIEYQVHVYDKEKKVEAVVGLVGRLKQRYPMPGQIVVYCDTVQETVRLAEALGCVCFHRNVGNTKEKGELVRQLTEGRQQVFTATNALGLGVDAPTIRAVVHCGTVRKMRHYAQESGRAGRDGKKSEAIVMRAARVDRRGNNQKQRFGKEVEEEMQEFIDGKGCMRVVMDEAMDGRRDRRRCEEMEEKCQRCQGQYFGEEIMEEERAEEIDGQEERGSVAAAVEEQAKRIEFEQELMKRKTRAMQHAESQGGEALEVEGLVELMEEWKTGCQRCRAFDERCEGHRVQECQREGAEDIRNGVQAFQKQIRWARFSGCFECGLPQQICQKWEGRAQGGWQKVVGECQYKEVLVWTVFSLWVRYTEEFGSWIEEEMNKSGWKARSKNGREMEEIVGWFGRGVQWGGVESNQMCVGLCRFVQVVQG